ncbi:MAG: phosphotransferase, partial [Proteobacteria bacterium]|nr:phosphotransferase [Pseudomonadota bacterium]
LYRFHQLRPTGLPAQPFFELLHKKWGALARRVLEDCQNAFPPAERVLCEPLSQIYSEATRRQVASCIPDGPLVFCHNDTYHGNIMRQSDGAIRLLDFEFSCLNHPAFDFANLFAETVMIHGLADPPHFRIDKPRFGDSEISVLVDAYLDQATFRGRRATEADSKHRFPVLESRPTEPGGPGVNNEFDDPEDREAELCKLVSDTRKMLLLSDYMYAMAALPLALEPVQKIRFIPYASQRFARFKSGYQEYASSHQPLLACWHR